MSSKSDEQIQDEQIQVEQTHHKSTQTDDPKPYLPQRTSSEYPEHKFPPQLCPHCHKMKHSMVCLEDLGIYACSDCIKHVE